MKKRNNIETINFFETEAYKLYCKDWETEMTGPNRPKCGSEEYKNKMGLLLYLHPKVKRHIDYLNHMINWNGCNPPKDKK